MNLVLIAPQIPHNTGAVARLCVGLGARLHLIRPLGFSLRESRVKRAALDYWEHVDLVVHADWEAYLATAQPDAFCFASTKGARGYLDCRFTPGTHLVFGNETEGLPAAFYDRYRESLYQIPMPGPHARSINLANAAAIVAYEAYRQLR
ncbi:MAG: tRNA (cytidine(34)-2'-O)-methyltransferase [Lentisphaerae bacterium]|nr:tRNA (cytidine(34)-2'-O)-methyltransferase [Lentisphaerota bacterium]